MPSQSRAPRPKLLSAVIRAILLSPLLANAGYAATCSVNSTLDDAGDAAAKVIAVPPGAWSGPNANVVTLRDCIVAANLMTGSTGVPNGTMNIDLSGIAGQTVALSDNLPLIFNNVAIDGGNAAAVAIDGSDAHRLFFVSGLPSIPPTGRADPDGSQATTLALHNLVLENGKAEGGNIPTHVHYGGAGLGAGGALFLNKAVSATLNHVSFQNNRALGGGLLGVPPYGGSGGAYPYSSGAGMSGVASGSAYEPYGDCPSASGISLGGGIGVDAAGGGSFGGTGIGQVSNAQGFGSAFSAGASAKGDASSGGIGGGGGGSCIGQGGNGGFGGGGGGNRGSGGFFGGGGDGYPGSGHGGFGGGGGGFGGAGGGFGGAGGFGAGGGGFSNGPGGAGGSAGGPGNTSTGGGGAGFGGAVFVRAGASLVVHEDGEGSLSGGAATTNVSGPAAAGSGLFLMSGAATTLDIAGRYVVEDDIADNSLLGIPSGQTWGPGCTAGMPDTTDPGVGPRTCGAGLIKNGAGTLVFNGIGSFAGPVQINAGRLAGTGMLGGSVNLQNGAHLAPGDPHRHGGIGTLSLGQLTWFDNGVVDIDLGHDAVSSDHIDVAGLVSMVVLGPYRFHFGMGGRPPVAGTTYTLIQAGSVSAGALSYDFDPLYTALTGNFTVTATSIQFTVLTVASDRLLADGFD